MKIALVGYGKMGKAIEEVILSGDGSSAKHEITARIDHLQNTDISKAVAGSDVAIEFTRPEAAFENIMACFDAKVPVICGTTGWLQQIDKVKQRCEVEGQSFFYAPNYSIGVNLFFKLNQWLARLMDRFPQYNTTMEEVHHMQKLDSPSGTAIKTAEDIIKISSRLNDWAEAGVGAEKTSTRNKYTLYINTKREPDVPGTHIVKYESPVDSIEIKHTAFSRKGFAEGAVTAAEWLVKRKGFYTMDDLIKEQLGDLL